MQFEQMPKYKKVAEIIDKVQDNYLESDHYKLIYEPQYKKLKSAAKQEEKAKKKASAEQLEMEEAH
jgi:hypothetical protein